MTRSLGLSVVVDRLTRRFRVGTDREIVALDAVSLEMPPGEVLGLLGPNGAGKTTLVKILSTILLPTSGSARVGPYDVVRDASKLRPMLGIIFGGDRGLYDRLTAIDNLLFWGALYGLGPGQARSEARRLLSRVGLEEEEGRAVETFSRGMKQRLHLARGLIGDPAVLFLDEPTAGLDPVATLAFRDLVEELRTEGRSMFIATHNMEEAQALCQRVALIDRGQVIAMEVPDRLSLLVGNERIEAHNVPEGLIARLKGFSGVNSVESLGNCMVKVETTGSDVTNEVLRLLVEAGITSLRTTKPTLEEAYVHLLGSRKLTL